MAQLGELFWYDEKRFLEIYQPKGFKREWMLKPITELSGGELTKVRIIKLFFENNDLIILDEPSNHLDQDNFNWLTKYLVKENQSALIITHDERLLNIADSIYELTSTEILHTQGSWQEHLASQEQKVQFQKNMLENQKQKLKQISRQIQKNQEKILKSQSSGHKNRAKKGQSKLILDRKRNSSELNQSRNRKQFEHRQVILENSQQELN
ncbi:ATP-binding cassette domain-containing protein [Neisseriaceae bacterium PsAf]|nr:ATP-binding cassette domain-containing protein [Neisseriaceae bacterium PsAf]